MAFFHDSAKDVPQALYKHHTDRRVVTGGVCVCPGKGFLFLLVFCLFLFFGLFLFVCLFFVCLFACLFVCMFSFVLFVCLFVFCFVLFCFILFVLFFGGRGRRQKTMLPIADQA